MSWINQHWGIDYITDAKNKIQQAVSVPLLTNGVLLILHEQMLIYRNKGPQLTASESEHVVHARTPKFMSLAAEYGLPDMKIGGSHSNQQTIEQEYDAYVTSSLSQENVDIIKFWEVSGT
jgi:hypothetical protein